MIVGLFQFLGSTLLGWLVSFTRVHGLWLIPGHLFGTFYLPTSSLFIGGLLGFGSFPSSGDAIFVWLSPPGCLIFLA
jgi:hypothetical protein